MLEPRRTAALRLLLLLATIFIVALCLDRTVATYLHDSGIAARVKASPWAAAAKSPGQFYATAAAAVLVAIVGKRWQDGAFVLLAAAISGVNGLVKWMAGRYRPFTIDGVGPFDLRPFHGGLYGLFHQRDLSFVSGHAALACATAGAVWIVRPTWPWRAAGVAAVVIVGAERVAENAHYCSDVVGAIVLGMTGVWALRSAVGRCNG